MDVGRPKFVRFLARLLVKLGDVNLEERFARLGTVSILLVLPIWVWWYQEKHIPDSFPEGARIINLTGVGSEGIWTAEPVVGYDYWWKMFESASIEVDQGDLVVLRLQSSDVTHVFYAPTLGVGPVTVEPGHVEVVSFLAGKQGIHEYYCMEVCGDCHFFMRGKIVVGGGLSEAMPSFSTQSSSACEHQHQAPVTSDLYEQGEHLFRAMRCVACHGEGGMGGVPNPNYVKSTVPALNTLARTMALEDREATDELIKLIKQGKNVDEMADMDTGIPRQRLVLAKYQIVRDVIHEGRPSARADATSFEPPLSMPMWGQKLSDRDIDALVVYLLKQQSWEDKE